jgi:hypothetical protein
MNPMSSGQSAGSGAAVRTALAPTTETRRTIAPARTPLHTPAAPVAPSPKSDGYGLPCAKCRKYYSATLSACPVCQSSERVSPIAAIPTASAAATQNNGAVLDEEKARLLREFKAKLYAAHTQISPTNHACTYSKEGETAHESAAVCRTCYERLQARVDLLEAALHMDLKEAAQVIYDAVWADTSDSNKTYQNAARALLGELRKRAGMKLILGRMQPLAH